MDADVVAEKSRIIARNLFESDEFKRAESVFIYVSLAKEVGTAEIIKRSLDEGKRVFVPVTDGDEMRLVPIDKNTKFKKGELGISVPVAEPVADVLVDIAIVPGLGFDMSGGRMGFGKGYYDRFLSKSLAKKIGLCFSELVVDEIAVDTHDVPMDMLVTEEGIFHCR